MSGMNELLLLHLLRVKGLADAPALAAASGLGEDQARAACEAWTAGGLAPMKAIRDRREPTQPQRDPIRQTGCSL